MKTAFGSFELNQESRELCKHGSLVPLPPKAFDVLVHLINNRSRLVPKRELLDTFWPANVSDAALLKSISLIRKALHEKDRNSALIKTHHGLGYRFVAEIAQPDEAVDEVNDFVLAEQRWASLICLRLPQPDADSNAQTADLKMLEKYLAVAKDTVSRHQGQLLHMSTDGFSAVFGLDILCDDAVRRAVQCASELIRTVDTQTTGKSNCLASIGIDTGPIELALLEKDQQWRPPIEIERRASQLAQKGQRGEILLSGKTFEHLSDEVEIECADTGYKLLSPPNLKSGIPGRPHKSPSRFVGRDAELAFIKANLLQLDKGQGKAILLSGAAGLGKTRLLSEFLLNHLPIGCKQIMLNCLPALSNTPLAPIKALVRTLTSANKIALSCPIEQALLSEFLAQDEFHVARLKSLSDHQKRQKSYQLIDKLLAQSCRDSPLVLAIEDVHWIDTTSKEHVYQIINSIGTKSLLLVLTARPLESSMKLDAELSLSPLGASECRDLLHGNPLINRVEPHVVAELIERAAGNPFFLEELAFAAQTNHSGSSHPPETIQAVITFRIASIATELRMMIYVIAVIGPPASVDLIAFLLHKKPADIHQQLTALIKEGFIVEDLGGFTFRHMLINDTAYSLIRADDRIRLHGQIAGFLESLSEARLRRPEKLAWHFQEAGKPDRAIPYWQKACRSALQQSTHYEASVFARKGLALTDDSKPEQRHLTLDLQLLLATSLQTLLGFGATEVGDAFNNARQLNQKIHNAKATIRIWVGLWLHSWVRGNLNESLDYARKLTTLAESSQNPSLTQQAHASLGQVLLHLGQVKQAYNHLISGLACIKQATPNTLPKQNSAVSCAAYAAWSASMLGNPSEAEHFYRVSAELSDIFPNPFAKAIHHSLCAEYFMFEGDAGGCLDAADKAIAISIEHKFNFWLGTGLVMRAWSLAHLGDVKSALADVKEGIRVFELTGAGVQLANWYGIKAEIELLAGHYHAGLKSADRALKFAYKAEDMFFVPHILHISSQLKSQLGQDKLAVIDANNSASLGQKLGIKMRADKD